MWVLPIPRDARAAEAGRPGSPPAPMPVIDLPVPVPLPTASKPLRELTDDELADYVTWLHAKYATPGERIAHAAMRARGTPYVIPASMFDHRQADCVTFVEHMLAMSLAPSGEAYHRLILRLRHADGDLGPNSQLFTIRDHRLKAPNRAVGDEAFLKRNHFTLTQWVPNNRWCLVDITDGFAAGGSKAAVDMVHIVRPRAFLAKLEKPTDGAAERIEHTDSFVPREAVPGVLGQLRAGAVVLVIVGPPANRDCNHMGLIVEHTPWDAKDPDGPPYILHAVPPKVRIESLVRFLRRFPKIAGFKFLRLGPDAERAALEQDAAMQTRVTLPAELRGK